MVVEALPLDLKIEIERRNRNGDPAIGHSNRYLFSGKIKCGVCGATFVSRTKKRKSGSSYKRWCCYNAATDGLRHIDDKGNEVGCNVGCLLRDELAHDLLQYSIRLIQAKPMWFAKRVIEQAKSYMESSEVTFTETQEEVEQEIKKLEEKKREVLDAFFSKDISKDDFRLMNATYDEKIKALQEKLEALRSLNTLEYDIRDLEDDIEAHLKMIAKQDPDDELFCRNLLDKIIVHPDKKIEMKLNLLPPSWAYVLARLEELKLLKQKSSEGCHIDSSVSVLFDNNSQNLPAEKVLQRNDFSDGCQNVADVPKAVIKKHPLPKVSSKVFNFPLFYDKGEIGARLRYIISFRVASDYHRRIVLPVFESSISTSCIRETVSAGSSSTRVIRAIAVMYRQSSVTKSRTSPSLTSLTPSISGSPFSEMLGTNSVSAAKTAQDRDRIMTIAMIADRIFFIKPQLHVFLICTHACRIYIITLRLVNALHAPGWMQSPLDPPDAGSHPTLQPNLAFGR